MLESRFSYIFNVSLFFIFLVWKSTLLPDFVINATTVTTELLYTKDLVPVLVFRCMFNLINGYKYIIVWYALHLIILYHSLKTRNYVVYMQKCKEQICTHTQSLPYLCNSRSETYNMSRGMGFQTMWYVHPAKSRSVC